MVKVMNGREDAYMLSTAKHTHTHTRTHTHTYSHTHIVASGRPLARLLCERERVRVGTTTAADVEMF